MLKSLKSSLRHFNQRSIIIWRFIDGKIGHEKQSAALIFELEKLISLKVYEFQASTFSLIKSLFFKLGQQKQYNEVLKPDIIIGVGHSTHVPIFLAKLRFGGKSVVIMKPSLPYSLFDLCLVPVHDKPPNKNNIVPIIGSLNKISESTSIPKEAGLCTFLIGGPSIHYKWSSTDVLEQIENLIYSEKYQKVRFVLTTSRRTPSDFIKDLKQRALRNIEVFDFSETHKGWIENILQKSAFTMVTPDSISMIYEALSAKCMIGLLKLEPFDTSKSRVVKNIDYLIQEGYISETIYLNEVLPPKNTFPNQAVICAKEIISKFFN